MLNLKINYFCNKLYNKLYNYKIKIDMYLCVYDMYIYIYI